MKNYAVVNIRQAIPATVRAEIAVGVRAIREQVRETIFCKCAASQTTVDRNGPLRCGRCGRAVIGASR